MMQSLSGTGSIGDVLKNIVTVAVEAVKQLPNAPLTEQVTLATELNVFFTIEKLVTYSEILRPKVCEEGSSISPLWSPSVPCPAGLLLIQVETGEVMVVGGVYDIFKGSVKCEQRTSLQECQTTSCDSTSAPKELHTPQWSSSFGHPPRTFTGLGEHPELSKVMGKPMPMHTWKVGSFTRPFFDPANISTETGAAISTLLRGNARFMQGDRRARHMGDASGGKPLDPFASAQLKEEIRMERRGKMGGRRGTYTGDNARHFMQISRCLPLPLPASAGAAVCTQGLLCCTDLA